MQQGNLVRFISILSIPVIIIAIRLASDSWSSNWLTMNTLPTIALTAAAITLLVIIGLQRARRKRKHNLQIHGCKKGTAVIRGMNQIVRNSKKAPIIEVIADVSSGEGNTYPVVMNMPASMLSASRYTIGSSVSVLINPENAQDVVIDFRH